MAEETLFQLNCPPLKGSAASTTKGGKSYDQQGCDHRLMIVRQELLRRQLQTEDGRIPLGGVHPLPPEFLLAKGDVLRQIRGNPPGKTFERNSLNSAKLRIVHEELISRPPRQNHLSANMQSSSIRPGIQATALDIEMNRGTMVKQASDTPPIVDPLTFMECEAPLKSLAPSESKQIRRHRNMSKNKSSGRNQSSLIPKTSPLARYKRQWRRSSRSLSPASDSCAASLNSLDCSDDFDQVDVTCVNTPTIVDDVDSNGTGRETLISEENEDLSCEKSSQFRPERSDLSELAHNLSCLILEIDVNGIFETRVSSDRGCQSSSSSFPRTA